MKTTVLERVLEALKDAEKAIAELAEERDRLYTMLHGEPGDGMPIGEDDEDDELMPGPEIRRRAYYLPIANSLMSPGLSVDRRTEILAKGLVRAMAMLPYELTECRIDAEVEAIFFAELLRAEVGESCEAGHRFDLRWDRHDLLDEIDRAIYDPGSSEYEGGDPDLLPLLVYEAYDGIGRYGDLGAIRAESARRILAGDWNPFDRGDRHA